jgi:hypothetical protein
VHGHGDPNTLLVERDRLDNDLGEIIEEQTESWTPPTATNLRRWRIQARCSSSVMTPKTAGARSGGAVETV